MSEDYPKAFIPEILAIEPEEGAGFKVGAFDSYGERIPFSNIEDTDPDPGNGGGDPGAGAVEVVRFEFVPIWDQGATSPPDDPVIGSGKQIAELIVVRDLLTQISSCNLHIDLVSAGDTQPGRGSGGYQFYLPDDLAEFVPPPPEDDGSHDYVRSGGSAVWWIAGKHWTGGVKWTFREFRNPDAYAHGPRPKLIMQLDLQEWTPLEPTPLAGRAWNFCCDINYTIRS